MGNVAGKLGKTLRKLGSEAKALGKIVGQLGTAIRKMGTGAFASGSVAGKMGMGVGKSGTGGAELGARLRNWGRRREKGAADGSWPVWGKRTLRSARIAVARWLAIRLPTDSRLLMEA